MNLYVLGGDKRIGFMAEALLEKGETVKGLGLSSDKIPEIPLQEGAKWADAVIGGVPVTKDGKTVFAPALAESIPLETLVCSLSAGTPLLCGLPQSDLTALCKEHGVPLINYFTREELALQNAIPTAEGAIGIAMELLPITLWEANCLVTGFGRIGKYLARLLSSFGAKVTVAARKQTDFAICRTLGYAHIPIGSMEKHVKHFDIIFSTVPAPLFTASVLSAMGKDTPILDLASMPGSVDTEAARAFHIPVVHALSLPGKVAPKTAGRLLADTVQCILLERNS